MRYDEKIHSAICKMLASTVFLTLTKQSQFNKCAELHIHCFNQCTNVHSQLPYLLKIQFIPMLFINYRYGK